MNVLVRVMFWLDAALIAVLFVMPHSPALWMWGVSFLHLITAGWMWHMGRFDPPAVDYQQLYEAERAAHRTNREASDKIFMELHEEHRRVIELWAAAEHRTEQMCKVFYEYYYTGNGHAKRYVDSKALN